LIEAQFEPGSQNSVLKNLLGIKKKKEMDALEAEEQLRTLTELVKEYDLKHRFTAKDICAIHKAWIGDIYSWAGEYRNLNISKDGFSFATAKHICIGYLWDKESLEDEESLFKKIINEWKSEQIMDVIQYFWSMNSLLEKDEEENKKSRKKILEFWEWVYENKYKGKDETSFTLEDEKILSAISKLTVYLKEIDSNNCEWLKLSASYVHVDYNDNYFIEYLDMLAKTGSAEQTAKYVGGIYLKMLEKSTPTYPQNNILSTVEFLYSAGTQDDADRICNTYGERGHEFLRDIWRKNNK